MELREYWMIVRRWWWLLVLCTFLGAGAAFLVSQRIDPTYESSALVMIGGSLDVVNPTTGELQTSEKLAQTYAELVKTRPVLDAARDALGLTEDPVVAVTLVRNTQLLRLTVEDTLPERAAATANELARQLILQSPSAPEREERVYREFVQEQLNELQAEIATLSQAIIVGQDTLSPEERLRLQQELNTRRDNYSSLLSYIRTSSINYIRVIEAATPPRSPTKPKVLQNTLLAAIVGLMLAGGAAFLFEYLDDSIKSQGDIEETLGLPALGAVSSIASVEGAIPETIALTHPEASISEAYRIVAVNLRYSLPADTQDRVFLVTSVGPSEGKSTTASNLAIVMARSGQRVVLVDADLRRPRQHVHYGYSGDKGLSSYLVGEERDLDALLCPTALAELHVLPSGPTPPNASELLGSQRMKQLLQELTQRADVIILDSPPLFVVADASILASIVTGAVLVVEAGGTKLAACLQASEDIKRTGGRLLGVVINFLDTHRGGYGYYDRYGSRYGNYYRNAYSRYGATEEQRDFWQALKHRLRRIGLLPRRNHHR